MVFQEAALGQSVISQKGILPFEGGCDEIPPKYPGGVAAMKKLFADSMNYPKKAEQQGIGGKVLITYMIDTFGYTTNIKIYKGVREDLNNEAIRLVKMLKGWQPATANGHKIVYYERQPFLFIPEEKGILKRKTR